MEDILWKDPSQSVSSKRLLLDSCQSNDTIVPPAVHLRAEVLSEECYELHSGNYIWVDVLGSVF